MIEHECGECGHRLRSKDKNAGLKVKCPECGAGVRVPKLESPLDEEPEKPRPKSKAEAADAPAANSARDRKRSKARDIFKELPKKLPDEVDELGAPLSLHKSESTPQSKLITLLVGFAFFGLTALIALLWYLKVMDWSALALWGGLSTIIGGLLIVVSRTDHYRRVVTFEKGLLVIDGKDQEVIRWDEIDDLYQEVTKTLVSGATVYTSHKYAIFYGKNNKKTFQYEPEIEVLGEHLQREVTRVKLPKMIAACNAGEELHFGPLVVDQAGLTHKKESLDWSDIQAIKLENGQFVIRRKGKWLDWGKVAVADVPNVMVFLALVDNILGIDSNPHAAKKH